MAIPMHLFKAIVFFGHEDFRSFLNFLENSVVHEENLNSWEFGKGALSANVYFFGIPSWATGALQTQFWIEDALIAGMVEKICLSGEERLFRRSWVISGAKGNVDNRPKGIEAKGQESTQEAQVDLE